MSPIGNTLTVPPHDGTLLKLLKNRLVTAGTLILVVLSLAALLAPPLTTFHVLNSPDDQQSTGLDDDGMPVSPGKAFPLGTDHLGRDVLSRVVYGARVSLTIGIGAMIVATVIGVSVGLAAGFYGGKIDMGLMRFTEMNMSIPAILLAIAFAGLMDGKVLHLHPASLPWHFLDVRLKPGMTSLFLIIGLVVWPGIVRVVRGQVLEIKEREFVVAARAVGASNRRIIVRHILPNVLPTIIVLAAMSTSNTILLEAGLGYLGVGVPQPTATWGSMLADGQPYFAMAPRLVVVPGLAIALTVLAFNLLGQGLQEVLDPRAAK